MHSGCFVREVCRNEVVHCQAAGVSHWSPLIRVVDGGVAFSAGFLAGRLVLSQGTPGATWLRCSCAMTVTANAAQIAPPNRTSAVLWRFWSGFADFTSRAKLKSG